MFQGFTMAASDFFWELSFNNERSWFEPRKEEFNRLIYAPFKELAADTLALMEKGFPETGFKLHTARIYRDARRLFGRGPYKDHLWFSVKSDDVLLEGPMFWFEFGGAGYSYGMGFYSATAAQMAAFRRSIDANPARFLRLAGGIDSMREFRVTGEEYSRPKGTHDELTDKWYNRKRVGVECSEDFGGALLTPELPSRLTEAYKRLMPMYKYFLEFYHTTDEEEVRK